MMDREKLAAAGTIAYPLIAVLTVGHAYERGRFWRVDGQANQQELRFMGSVFVGIAWPLYWSCALWEER